MRTSKILLFTIAVCVAGPAAAALVEYTVDAPANAEIYDDPFTSRYLGATPARYQQVYSASLFSALPAGGAFLARVYFRMDRVNPVSSGQQHETGVGINASTTSRSPSSLSPVFDDNLGLDNKVWVDPGDISFLGSTSQGAGKIQGWGPLFGAGGSFFYDPAKGNLLLDISNLGGKLKYNLDAAADPTMGAVLQARGSDNIIEGVVSPIGLVTTFAFLAIPEPGVMGLTILGFALIWFARKMNTYRRKAPHVTP